MKLTTSKLRDPLIWQKQIDEFELKRIRKLIYNLPEQNECPNENIDLKNASPDSLELQFKELIKNI